MVLILINVNHPISIIQLLVVQQLIRPIVEDPSQPVLSRWLLPSLREAHGQNLGLLPVTWSTWKTSGSTAATEAV